MSFQNSGLFVEKYSTFEVQNRIGGTDPKKLAVSLMLRINKIAYAINNRCVGIHTLEAISNGETYAPLSDSNHRPVTQQTYLDGPLANAGALTIAHGITWDSTVTLVDIVATATDSSNLYAIPLPYVDVSSTPVTGDIEIYVDATNIVITSAGNASTFDRVVVTLKWLTS